MPAQTEEEKIFPIKPEKAVKDSSASLCSFRDFVLRCVEAKLESFAGRHAVVWRPSRGEDCRLRARENGESVTNRQLEQSVVIKDPALVAGMIKMSNSLKRLEQSGS